MKKLVILPLFAVLVVGSTLKALAQTNETDNVNSIEQYLNKQLITSKSPVPTTRSQRVNPIDTYLSTSSLKSTVESWPVSSVSVSPSSLTIGINETARLIRTISPSYATNQSCTWSTSNSNVVTVSSTGWLTGKGPGTARVTVRTTDGGKTDYSDVTVTFIPVTGISLNTNAITLDPGNTYNLIAEIIPTNATSKSVTWSSSNTNVAMVTNDGMVVSIGGGTAEIIAKTNDGNYTASCNVTVNVPNQGSRVMLNAPVLTLELYKSATLTSVVLPINSPNQEVNWISNCPNIVSVNNGILNALSVGNATIFAINDGAITGKCQVTVLNSNSDETPTINIGVSGTLPFTSIGSEIDLIPNVTHYTSPMPITHFMSFNPDVISVRPSDPSIPVSGVATAVSEGTTFIMATLSYSGATSIISASVDLPIPVTSITLNTANITLDPGETHTLIEEVLPANADDKTVTWTTSDPSIATVNAGGMVTAVKTGSATITATTNNGALTATCDVEVAYIPISDIVLNHETVTLPNPDNESAVLLTATISPQNATNKEITWSSDNPAVAVVMPNGLVIAREEGTATITATVDGGNSVTCIITVDYGSATRVSGLSIFFDYDWNMLFSEEYKTISTVNGELQIGGMVTPSNARNEFVLWSVTDPSIVEVTPNPYSPFGPPGGAFMATIRAIGEGTADIIATSADGAYTAICHVTVDFSAPPESIAISPGDDIIITTPESSIVDLLATVVPSDAPQEITWSSSNPAVASVDANGTVTAHTNGVVTITAATDHGRDDLPNIESSLSVSVHYTSGGGSPWTDVGNKAFTLNRNVGIEVFEPRAKLHIDSKDSEDAIYFERSNSEYNHVTARMGIGGPTTGPGLIMKVSQYDDPETTGFFIHKSGNVVIGDAYPTAKLTVDGGILAESIDIETDLAINGMIEAGQIKLYNRVPQSDFVFESGYKLMDLYELDSFVKTNKHLPEIPSAAEFLESGYNVAELHDVFLRKIEELTLYIIDLQEQIEKLQTTETE